jgi:SAM-dependent methyltransferase
MTSTEWGTEQWQNDHFPENQLDSDGDTWGMRWRGMDRLRHSTYLRLIGPDLQAGQSLRVLDIGCALCDFTRKAWALNRKNQFWCMDISENAIAWNKKKFPEFTFKTGAIPDIPFDVEFDWIFCLEVLAYLSPDDRAKTIENIHRKLGPSGILVFSGVLDKGRQHHTEDEITHLIELHFDVRRTRFNHWAIYRKLIESPFDRVRIVANILLQSLAMSKEEFQQWSAGGDGGNKVKIAKILRLARPISQWVLRAISSVSKFIIGSKTLALIFHLISNVVRGRKNADEIVLVAVKN